MNLRNVMVSVVVVDPHVPHESMLCKPFDKVNKKTLYLDMRNGIQLNKNRI